jgi:hypothetical protein
MAQQVSGGGSGSAPQLDPTQGRWNRTLSVEDIEAELGEDYGALASDIDNDGGDLVGTTEPDKFVSADELRGALACGRYEDKTDEIGKLLEYYESPTTGETFDNTGLSSGSMT